MRRFAVTGFALLYAVLVYGLHTGRTCLWLESLPGQSSTHDTIIIQDDEESIDSRSGQKRTLPDQAVFVSPLVTLGIVLKSDQHVALLVEKQIPGHFPPSVSPRAPPVLS